MKKLLFGLLVAGSCCVGCADDEDGVPIVRIAPNVTRVTGLHFDAGDRIGLTVVRASGTYAENRMMTYDGSLFTSAGFYWYRESGEEAELTAYYPYDEAGTPSEFSVAADQRSGCALSNLMVASKSGVRPSESAVAMTFRSLMADVQIAVNNQTQTQLVEVTVDGTIPTASVDFGVPAATVASDRTPVRITACELQAGSAYEAVLVPQRASMTFTVRTDDGKSRSKTLAEVLLEPNKQYTLSMTLTEEKLDLTLSGEIDNWEPGGELGADEPTDLLEYAGESYRTVEVDGRLWMAENLRYCPDGAAFGSGVWYPGRSGEACSDAEYVRQCGLLYDYATATGRTVAAAASAGGPVRGVCPDGWHIPDQEELASLLASSVEGDFPVGCGFWNAVRSMYGSETKSYLMGVSESDESLRSYLLIENGVKGSIAKLSANNGVSVRCVRDL